MVSPLFSRQTGQPGQPWQTHTRVSMGLHHSTQRQRIAYARRLQNLSHKADPVRRVYILKPNNPKELRPLGIPTMFQRALQALVKLALEPEWEAKFEPNSYGFRPGRSPHDAIAGDLQFHPAQAQVRFGH